MRRLILMVSVWALAFAKPEMYKESEDFQYSRSSSDDGHQSGFYGAQRGNMGGNYERAHNMDGLAQHQMGTAVRQVEGELGEGAKTRTGSVSTSANSRGIFGSGNYDVSNLKGRNFEESFFDSAPHSSLTSQNSGYRSIGAHNAAHSSGYTKSSRHSSGYQSADYSGHHSTDYGQNENAHAEDLHEANNQYSYGSQAASDRQTAQYDAALHNVYDSNTYGRRITDTPVRVVMRPGSVVTIPVSGQAYDASSLRTASFGQNNINSEAEELSNSDRHVYVKPGVIYYNKPKHYESSYNYRKEWERHNAQPVATIPTENPFPKNGELYDDSLLLQNAKNQYNGLDSSSAHSSSANIAHSNSASAAQSNSYIANTKSSTLNKSKYRYESQTQNAAAAAQSNAYTLGAHNSGSVADGNELVEDINSKPKSYHSSYSYHKSWERRGDPYVIKPVGGDINGQTSQRLVSASANEGIYSSHKHGSLYNQAQQSLSQNGIDCDCDENGHIRVARSASPGYRRIYDQDGDQQQYENIEDLGQQTQNQRLGDLGQQTQSEWDNIQDLGQQTQNKWDNLQDLGQQTQNKWDDLQELGQQSQNKWDNLEYLGQQTQSDFQQQNVGQETENQWDRLEKFNEQTPRDAQQQTQDNFEPFNEQRVNEESMVPPATFNQYRGTDEQKENSEDTFWDQKQNFNTQEIFQNNDQKESFSEVNFQKEDDQDFQQQLQIQKQLISTMYDILNKHKSNTQNNGAEFYKPLSGPSDMNIFQHNHNLDIDGTESQNTDFSQYSYNHHSSLHNDENKSSWQSHYHNHENSNNNPSPLGNFWNKLDNLDSHGGLNINKDKNSRDEDTFSNSRPSYWGQSNSDNSYGSHDSKFNFFPTQKEEDSSIANSRGVHETISSNTFSQTPLQTTEKALTTGNNPKANVPVKPIDVGRGDIGADETLLSNAEDTDNENTNIFYHPRIPNKPYKSPEEIESLSLTKLSQNKDTTMSNHNYSNDEMLNEFFENHDNGDNSEQKIQEHQSLSNQKWKHISSTTVKNIAYKPTEYVSNYNLGKALSRTTEQLNKHNEESLVSRNDKEAMSNIYDVEPSPIDIEQSNTDQQFEDFGQYHQNPIDLEQQIQNSWQASNMQKNTDQQFEDQGQDSFDLGQQIQSFLQSSHNFERSEEHPINKLPNYENNDNQQSQVPAIEQFGSNEQLQSQSLLNFDQQSNEYKKDDQQQLEHIEQFLPEMHSYRNHNTPVVDEQHRNQNIEKQLTPQHIADEVPFSKEEATEKPGFWKSVGSKFKSAKDSVVSWFKTS